MSKKQNYIANKIFEYRMAAGLDQVQLSELLGLSRQSIINIEKGRHFPNIHKLLLLCSIFGCQPNDLLPNCEKITLSGTNKTVRKVVVKTRVQYKKVKL